MNYIPMDTEGGPDNLLRVYEQAAEDLRAAGAQWYAVAHAALQAIAEQTGHTLPVTVGVAAVLSPFLSWDMNLKAAEAVLTGQTGPGFKHNQVKAFAITGGAPPETVLSGPKVTAFYDNLLHPDHPELVVVDRHIVRVWAGGGPRGQYGCKNAMYHRIADDVKAGALQVGLPFHHFQAAVWLAARS